MTKRKVPDAALARSIASFQRREGDIMENDYPELPAFLRRAPLNGHEVTLDPSEPELPAEYELGAALAPDVPRGGPVFRWVEVAHAFIGTIVIIVLFGAAAAVYHLVFHSGAGH